MLSRRRPASRAMLPAAVLAGVLAMSGCSGCTPITVTVRDVPAPVTGQPVVLVAEVTDEQGPVAGLGVTFDVEIRGVGSARRGDAVTDQDGIARNVLPRGLASLRALPGEEVLGYRAYFTEGNPFQPGPPGLCSDESEIGRLG